MMNLQQNDAEKMIEGIRTDIEKDVAEAGDKVKTLMRSRRFWTCIAATTVTGLLYGFNEIDGQQFTHAVTLIASIYIGSVALEDGLRNLVTLWLQTPGERK